MSERRRYRIFQNMLSMSGAGIVLLGVWDTVKVIMFIMFDRESLYELFSVDDADDLYKTMTLILIVAILILILLIKLMIGKTAHAEAKGDKKGYVYLFFVLCMILISFPTSYVISEGDSVMKMDMIWSIIIDSVSCIVMAEIILASLMVKRYRKKGYE